MIRFPFTTCADLRIALARELANAHEWSCDLAEAKARTVELIASSRELMAEVDVMLALSKP